MTGQMTGQMTGRQVPDGNQPASRVAVTGLRYAAVLLVGGMVLPLLVGRALRLPPADVAQLVNVAVLVCGVGTMLLAMGAAGLVGVRLPVMMGGALAALGPLLAIAGDASLGTAAERLQVIGGAMLVAGLVVALSAQVGDRLLEFFPPVVRGATALMIGIVALRAAVGWMAAEASPGLAGLAAPLSPPGKLGLAALVLGAIVLITRFGPGWADGIAVGLGIVGGGIAAGALGAMSFAPVKAAPWLGLVTTFPFGWPRFELVPTVALSAVMLVAMIETSVMLRTAAAQQRSAEVDADSVRGLRADGLMTMLAGVFAAMPCASMSAAAGERAAAERMACAVAGLVLLALGLSPKLGALVEAIPQVVLGGAGLILFGAVAAHGVAILADVDYERHRQNLFIVALSIGIGLIPLVAPQFFKVVLANVPALAPLLQSSVVLTVVAALALNLFFNGLGGRTAVVGQAAR